MRHYHDLCQPSHSDHSTGQQLIMRAAESFRGFRPREPPAPAALGLKCSLLSPKSAGILDVAQREGTSNVVIETSLSQSVDDAMTPSARD